MSIYELSNYILSGEKIQELTDMYIGNRADFEWNPRITLQSSKFKYLETFNEPWENPKLLFCYSHCIQTLSPLLHLFKNPCIIIFGNSDESMKVFGKLSPFKTICEPQNCLYAHSDSYPTFEWKLHRQFSFELLNGEQRDALNEFNLDVDYFQSTMIIYDTTILEDSIMDDLFELIEKFPSARWGDQPILNLYFNCTKGLWRQIPLRSQEGFLYDYHQREGYSKSDYLMLKMIL